MNNNARKTNNLSNPGDRTKPEDTLDPTDLADVSLEAPFLPSKQPTSRETEKGDTKIEEDEFEIRRKRFFELK